MLSVTLSNIYFLACILIELRAHVTTVPLRWILCVYLCLHLYSPTIYFSLNTIQLGSYAVLYLYILIIRNQSTFLFSVCYYVSYAVCIKFHRKKIPVAIYMNRVYVPLRVSHESLESSEFYPTLELSFRHREGQLEKQGTGNGNGNGKRERETGNWNGN